MIFEEMKQALIDAAEQAGVKDYEIYYQNSEYISVETLKDEVSSFSSGVSGGICFRCIVDGRMGYASGELMTKEAMETLVASAISNAKCIESDDEAIIFAGSETYEKTTAPEPVLADAVDLRRAALDLQKRTYEASDKVGDGTQSYVASEIVETHLYNSNRLSLSNRVGMTGSMASAVVRDRGEAQAGSEFATGISGEAFSNLPGLAVDRALSRIGAVEVASGKYNVVFSGRRFSDFLATFSDIFSAKQAALGLSLLAGKEGESIAAPCVTLVDDPLREGHSMQAPFDDEGVATKRKNVIENGVLKTLLYDLSTARRAGKESTGNGQKAGYGSTVSIAPYSFSVAAGDKTEEELFRLANDGIYVTECKGFHAGADPVTGDFSIESAGFRIRNGKLAEPIKSFTVAGNFYDLLKQIECCGNEVHWPVFSGFTGFGAPNLLVRNMSIAGK